MTDETNAALRDRVAAELTATRARTAALTDAVDDDDLMRQHSPLMSPLVWDLAHVGNQEELWLVRDVGGREPVRRDIDELYDAFRHPRADRPALPLLDPAEARRYTATVRDKVLDLLDTVPLAGRPLVAGGFAFGMIIQHEQQHDETMLATHQLRAGPPVLAAPPPPPAVPQPRGRAAHTGAWSPGAIPAMLPAGEPAALPDAGLAAALSGAAAGTEAGLPAGLLPVGRPAGPAPAGAAGTAAVSGEVLVPAGPFTMGTSTDPWALDNERPGHRVDLPAFFIDAAPVTNAGYLAFIEDGGYHQRRWWSDEGWTHRTRAGLVAPMHWHRDGDRWAYTRFGRTSPLVPDEPVVHVSYHEADAYARWSGRRLPTEAEWEKTARFDPRTGRSRRYPWGDGEPTPALANLGQRHLAPAPVGAYPDGASPLGVHQLIGDVWEWTSTDFAGYPGFAAFPYREYSEVFFGTSYKVLRGGSFGTAPAACRGTFRNWDFPIRRQIFSGFRCARDPLPGEA